jgi:hypothetical protein
MFRTHDIETEPLAETDEFDAIILESCLHHLFDPIQALAHLRQAAKPEGLMAIIEGENRKAGIKPDYLQIMLEMNTLERPFSRRELTDMLVMTGWNAHEFLGAVNGWFSPQSPEGRFFNERLRCSAEGLNLVVCAQNPNALLRIYPWWGGATERPEPAPTPEEPRAQPTSVPTDRDHLGTDDSLLRELTRAHEERDTCKSTLEAIERSAGWKILQRWRGIRNRLLPANSRRRRCYEAALRNIVRSPE